MKLISIGYGSYAAPGRMVAVVEPESNPVKRIITQAREAGKLVDATYGRKTMSVLVMDSGHVILCPLDPDTIQQRAEEAGEGG